jgi:hypothetical protein
MELNGCTARWVAASLLLAAVIGGPARAHPVTVSTPRAWRAEAESALAALDTLPLAQSPPPAAGIIDPVFAYLIALLDTGRYGIILQEHFQQAVERQGRRSRIPVELIQQVRRARAPGGGFGWVRIAFTEPVHAAVPYSILGYHPGSLVSSPEVTLEEWHSTSTIVANPDPKGPSALELQDLTLWAVEEGQVVLDIDGWVDALLGGQIDDTRIVGLALFRFRGERLAMALGFNADGEGRSGVLDLHADQIRFPSPSELRAIGRNLRGRVVRRLARRGIPAWVPEGGVNDSGR